MATKRQKAPGSGETLTEGQSKEIIYSIAQWMRGCQERGLRLMKINKLEIENVKRVKAVVVEPTHSGLTVIGGRNGQGKTSVLDAIAWALGGERYRPSQPQRDGSVLPPSIHITMDNGLIVERKGKNSTLKVIDPNGNLGGQQLLNRFVEQLALDLPKFMQVGAKEKAQTLLKIIGVGDRLAELEREEGEIYNRRHAIGQIADQKAKYAAEMTHHPDAPKEPVSASELITRQQRILAQNGENQRKRENLTQIEAMAQRYRSELEAARAKYDAALADLETARKSALDLHDESTEALERDIERIELINNKVRANLDKERAEGDAKELTAQYAELTAKIDAVRAQKTALLNSAALPLSGLGVEEGELIYRGYKWDNLSGADQLRVATAIVRQLNPECGFVLLDKLEQMDTDTLREFGEWLEAEGLQAIATRVSTGGECSIIISDGYAMDRPQDDAEKTAPAWREGTF